MMNILLVGLGGGLGAICRYGISSIPVRTGFPVLTLIVNLLGAMLIGVVVGITETKPQAPAWLSPLVKTGFCGGFTTFSTFSLETLKLWGQKQYGASAAYALLSVALCVLGVFLGRMLIVRQK